MSWKIEKNAYCDFDLFLPVSRLYYIDSQKRVDAENTVAYSQSYRADICIYGRYIGHEKEKKKKNHDAGIFLITSSQRTRRAMRCDILEKQ